MSMTFTKLFSSITESTIWGEPDHIRIAWITMLAMADSRGRVWASIPGLANRARISVEQAEEAIWRFQQPDRYSRTPDNEGRRIEPIDGGWRLLNHEKYRQIRDEEAIKESKRRYINTRRAKERDDDVEGVEKCRTPSNSVDEGRDNADADADAEAEAGSTSPKGDVAAEEPQPQPKEARKRAPKPQRTADEIVRSFEEDETYNGINVREQWGKMVRWCEVNRKHPSERRFVNWLNRVEKPVSGTVAKRPESNQMQEEIDVPILRFL